MCCTLRISVFVACVGLHATGQLFGASPADDQHALGTAHYKNQRWQLAADEFGAFLQQFPQDDRVPAVVFYLGESLVQLRRYSEARNHFQDLLRRFPQDRRTAQAEFRVSELTFLLGQLADARGKLEAFRARWPQDPMNAYALAYLGDIALSEGDGSLAERLFREALEKSGVRTLDLECRFGLARALELRGNLAEATRFYRFLADQQEIALADDAQLRLGILLYKQKRHQESIQALQVFESGMARSGLCTEARYWRGLAQMALSQHGDAAKTFAKAIQDAPDHGLVAALEFSLGEAFRKTGETASAKSHYVRVVEQWPASDWADDAMQVLADLAMQAGDHARVAEIARQFSDRHATSPLRPYVEQARGRALLKQERYAEAIEVFRSLARAPTEPAANGEGAGDSDRPTPGDFSRRNAFYLALAYLGSGKQDQGLTALEQVQPQAGEEELSAAVLAARGSALIALQRFGDAIPPLCAYLDARPNGTDAAVCRARLAIAQAETSDWEAAAKSWEQLREKHSGEEIFLTTTRHLAERAHSRNQLDFAKRLFTALAEAKSSQDAVAQGLAGLAKVQLQSGETSDSEKTLGRLLAQAPESSLAAATALLRAQTLEKENRHDAALAAYRVVVDKFAASEQAPAALLAAARLHAQQRQHEAARALLQRLVDAYPQFAHRDAALYRLAWALADLQKADEADAVFLRIVNECEGTPSWADAVYRLAERAAERKEYDRAAELLKRLLKAPCEPDLRTHALYLQGKTHAEQGRWNEVIGPMQQVVRDFPDSSLRLPAQYWIAEAHYHLDQYDAADTLLRQLTVDTKGRRDAWLAMVSLRRSQVLAQQGKWQEAYELAAGIPGQFPDFRQLYEVDYLLGRCLSSQARFAEAREAFQRVVGSSEGGRTETAAMAQWMIGESHFHQKEYDPAIRAYHRVVSLYAFPRWQAAAILQAGKCHELKGEWSEAAKLYSQLLQEHPDSVHAADAARRLSERRTTSHTTNKSQR